MTLQFPPIVRDKIRIRGHPVSLELVTFDELLPVVLPKAPYHGGSQAAVDLILPWVGDYSVLFVQKAPGCSRRAAVSFLPGDVSSAGINGSPTTICNE
jgi:hypothetical protein